MGVMTRGGGIVQTHHVVPLSAGHWWRRGSRAEVRTAAGVSDPGADVSPNSHSRCARGGLATIWWGSLKWSTRRKRGSVARMKIGARPGRLYAGGGAASARGGKWGREPVVPEISGAGG